MFAGADKTHRADGHADHQRGDERGGDPRAVRSVRGQRFLARDVVAQAGADAVVTPPPPPWTSSLDGNPVKGGSTTNTTPSAAVMPAARSSAVNLSPNTTAAIAHVTTGYA